MSHPNEPAYLAQFLRDWPLADWPAHLSGARILNIGSARASATPDCPASDYAPLFPDRDLVGVDLTPGPGVDTVCDMTGDCAALGREQFAAILCCSVLEHCERPWLAAANIERHLLPFGLLYVAVPWIWRAHAYPQDFWRMSADGVRLLFPRVRWKRIAYLSQAPDEQIPQSAASRAPWRFAKGSRVYLCSQKLHMIGRLS